MASVGGHLHGLDNPRMCFKCTPDTFAELIEREDIRPAPYVGRYKWVMLDRLDALADAELEDYIRQSYEMVAAKAPKRDVAQRPPSRAKTLVAVKKKSPKPKAGRRARKKPASRRKTTSRKPRRRR